MCMSYPFNVGPIAPERNPPINPQYYLPSVFPISAISMGPSTTVTTSSDNNYSIGQEVRFVIPSTYGASELNNQTGIVTSIPSPDQVVVNINSIGYSQFNPTPVYGPTPPQILAIGDTNTGPINPFGRFHQQTFIPGSFINISPF